MGVKETGDWKKARGDLSTLTGGAIKKAIQVALNREGLYLVGQVKKRIASGPPPPLAYPRRGGAGKGGSKPLNAGGDLKNSVGLIEGDGEVFIGIARTASGHGGKVHNLAMIHEFGATFAVQMTQKMRGFLFGVLFKDEPKSGTSSHKGFLVIHIPARPFIRPTFEAEEPKIMERFVRSLCKALNGALGTP